MSVVTNDELTHTERLILRYDQRMRDERGRECQLQVYREGGGIVLYEFASVVQF